MSEYGSSPTTLITLDDLHRLLVQLLEEIRQVRTQRPATSRAVRDFRAEIEHLEGMLLALTNRVEQIEQQLRAWRVCTP